MGAGMQNTSQNTARLDLARLAWTMDKKSDGVQHTSLEHGGRVGDDGPTRP